MKDKSRPNNENTKRMANDAETMQTQRKTVRGNKNEPKTETKNGVL